MSEYTNAIEGHYFLSAILFLLTFFYWIYKASLQKASKKVHASNEKTMLDVIYLRLVFLILWFLTAFRGLSIGNDTIAYYEIYQTIQKYGVDPEREIEIGYQYFNAFLARIFPGSDAGFYLLLILSSSLLYWQIWKMIERKSPSFFLSIIVFFCLYYGTFQSMIRQEIAIAIVLSGVPFLEQKKPFRFALFVIAASFFHSSALVTLLFIIFYYYTFRWRWLVSGIVAATLISLFNIPQKLMLVLRLKTAYAVQTDNFSAVTVMLMLYTIYLGLNILLPKEERNWGQHGRSCEQVVHYGFLLWCMSAAIIFYIIAYSTAVMERMTLYFSLMSVIYVPEIIRRLKDQSTIFIISYVFTIMIWMYATIILLFRPEWNHIYPYSFFWS